MSSAETGWEAEIQALEPEIPLAQILYCVHVSLQHRYLYTITPKAACTALRSALRSLELQQTIAGTLSTRDIHARELSPTLTLKQVAPIDALLARPDIFKFCLVRNPYARLLSAYLDRVLLNKPQKRGVLRALGLADAPIETHVEFGDFVRLVGRQSVGEMDPHWRVQFYQTLQRGISYDYVGRTENFSEALAHIARRIGHDLGPLLPDGSAHETNADVRIDEYYSDELIGIVNRAFAKDFEAFGYAMR